MEVHEKAFISKLRMFSWDEIVHTNDVGDGLIVFLINNRLVINNFFRMSAVPLENDRSAMRSLLLDHNFISSQSMLLLNEDADMENLTANSTWYDMARFQRENLLDEDHFGALISHSLGDGLFRPRTMNSLNKQLSCALRQWHSSGSIAVPESSRLVIVVEVVRYRQILNKLRKWYSYLDRPLDDFKWALSTNPVNKIDPMFIVEQNLQTLTLVTEPSQFDSVSIPKDDSLNFVSLLGFLRSRMYFLYDDLERSDILSFVTARTSCAKAGAYPFRVSSPHKDFSSFVEILLSMPEDPRFVDHTCPICLDDFDDNPVQNDGSVSQICCRHLYHTDCIMNWYMTKSGVPKSCPYCSHGWPHLVEWPNLS